MRDGCYFMSAVVMVIMSGSITYAQAPGAQWDARYSTHSGTCRDGLRVHVTELPGLLKVHSEGDSSGSIKPFTWDVKLEADGSGTRELKSAEFGDLLLTVPAGKGKRPFMHKQAKGNCVWRVD